MIISSINIEKTCGYYRKECCEDEKDYCNKCLKIYDDICDTIIETFSDSIDLDEIKRKIKRNKKYKEKWNDFEMQEILNIIVEKNFLNNEDIYQGNYETDNKLHDKIFHIINIINEKINYKKIKMNEINENYNLVCFQMLQKIMDINLHLFYNYNRYIVKRKVNYYFYEETFKDMYKLNKLKYLNKICQYLILYFIEQEQNEKLYYPCKTFIDLFKINEKKFIYD